MKLVNNVVCAANVAIMGEALSLALACGLSLDDVIGVLDVSTGRNFMSASRGDAELRLRQWTQSRAVFDSMLAIVRKDVELVGRMAEATGTGRYPSIEGLSSLLTDLGDDTFHHWRRAAAWGPLGEEVGKTAT
jgi:3-hydroxyisobutyrate dehydrogenase